MDRELFEGGGACVELVAVQSLWQSESQIDQKEARRVQRGASSRRDGP